MKLVMKDRQELIRIWLPTLVLILSLTGFLIGIFIGYHVEELIFPGFAILIRDQAWELFKFIGADVTKYTLDGHPGIMFNDYTIGYPNIEDILTGGIEPHCLTLSIFFAMAGYLLVHQSYKIYADENKEKRVQIFTLLLKVTILVCLSYPYSLIRYIIILISFQLIWVSPIQNYHYEIGHDLIGNWILLLICLGLFFYREHKEHIKSYFQKKNKK